MAVREIRKWDDPVLKQKCEPVTVKELKKIKRDLEDTIRKTDTGVGMAAPQIGISKCVVIVKVPQQGLMLFANPVILESHEELDAYYEGCLSFPDHYVEIERPIAVHVRWMTRKGKTRQEWISGFAAKVLGHEMDHLVGRCLVGDAWRDGRTISGAELREMQAQEKARKKSPASALLGAAVAAAALAPPAGRACDKSTNMIERLAPRCSRTACKRPGSGYMHVVLAKQNPGEYNNYCVRCARKINAVNNEQLVVAPDEFQKVLFESKESDSVGDTGKPEEATV